MSPFRWIAAIALGAAAIVLVQVNPAAGGIYPPCPFRWLTGYYCPGCGSLRASHQLLHGHLAAAWRLNPMLLLALPVVGLASLGRGPVFRAFRHPATPWVVAAILTAYWIARNIPCVPFTALAPH